MTIADLYVKPVDRPINGVIKAEQMSEAIIWQELSEYVVTRELNDRLRRFLTTYTSVIDNSGDPNSTGKMGVWISGFFGSGKSHFLKVLGYLLGNREVHDPHAGSQHRPVEMFQSKLTDPMLYADLKRAADQPTEVILFNIDSRKDNSDKDSLLGVFLRVFNEKQGLCGEYPHIAHLERYLRKKGKMAAFETAFAKHTGSTWNKEREAYAFLRDEVIASLVESLGMSKESAAKWIDKDGEDYGLSIKSFAELVQSYLQERGPKQRLVFLVDEVGQFIGNNSPLMLNLQTITEELGIHCQGRAWIIVTSQQDIDAVLGEVTAVKANDFSKIQGRFQTRLSLSSSHADEVIQLRLLDKTESATTELKKVYEAKAITLKNQLRFDAGGPTLPFWHDANDFARCYPFPRYQFELVQKIFEAIRRVGATGLHLARGERSMLDAFQSALVFNRKEEVGVLVPLADFYPCIENFLDNSVSRTITQAADKLDPFAIKILRTLFLIRYNDQVVKATVDNLVTLCIDRIDADRIALKRQIEDALGILERENLIQRNGNLYQFLTNEEQDVKREISHVDISVSEDVQLVGEIFFKDILGDYAKHKYKVNKADYGFNRICDGQVVGRADNELTIEILSPVGDDYTAATPSFCVKRSNDDLGKILIRLKDNPGLGREVRTYLQTKKYVANKSDAAASVTLQRILKDQATNNGQRRTLIAKMLEDSAISGGIFIKGAQRDIIAAELKAVIAQSADYLIENLYTKLTYITKATPNIQEEIKQTILSADNANIRAILQQPDGNPQAIDDLRNYLSLAFKKGKVQLADLIDRYHRSPYGWQEWEIVLLVSRLARVGDFRFMKGTATVECADILDDVLKTARWRDLALVERRATGRADLDAIRDLGKELFSKIGPQDEDQLAEFFRQNVKSWQQQLHDFRTRSEAGGYPGKTDIDHAATVVNSLLIETDNFAFFTAIKKSKDDLRNLAAEELHDLIDFFTTKRTLWDRLLRGLDAIAPNRDLLILDSAAANALTELDAIRANKRPYSKLHRIDGLLTTVTSANETLIIQRRTAANAVIEAQIERLTTELKNVAATESQCSDALAGLQRLKIQISTETSIPRISMLSGEHLDQAISFALTRLQAIVSAKNAKSGTPTITTSPAKDPERIRAGTVGVKSILESEEDIEQYLSVLRGVLREAIIKSGRVRVL